MGDISEVRGLVVIFSFIGLFVLMVGLMVDESPLMFTESPEEGSSNIPDSSGAPMDFLAWNETAELNLTGGAWVEHWDFMVGGWITLITERNDVVGEYIYMATYDKFGPFIVPWSYDYFRWFYDTEEVGRNIGYPNGNFIFDITNINDAWAANESLTFRIQNGKTSMTVDFNFNTTAYVDPGTAFNAGGLSMRFNVDFEDRNTSINVLSFIGALFSFSLPGIDWRIQAIIMAPMTVCLAYLVFIFCLRVIGGVFGGGGS